MLDGPETLVSVAVCVVQRLKKLVVKLVELMFTFTETAQFLSFHDVLRQQDDKYSKKQRGLQNKQINN